MKLTKLNERFPEGEAGKLLLKAFKKHLNTVGYDSSVNQYGYHGINNKKYPVSLDFENSNWTQITPQEAKQYSKEGRIQDIVIIMGGQIVKFNSDGSRLYKALRNYSRNHQFKRNNGNYVDSSTALTFTQICDQADKDSTGKHLIFLEDPIYPNRELLQQRRENPESKYSKYDTFDIRQIVDIRNNGYRPEHGSEYVSNPADSWSVRWLKDIQDRIKEYQERLKYVDPNSQDYIALKNALQKRLEDEANCKRELEKIKYANKDYLAKRRYFNVELSYRELWKKIDGLKTDIDNANYALDKALNNKSNFVHSPQTLDLLNKQKNLKNTIADALKQLAIIEIQLNETEELDQKALDEINSKIDSLQTRILNNQNELNQLLGKKSPVIEQFLNESLQDSYQPWGEAVKTYNKIKKANKLNELNKLLDSLYPEGLSNVQINDILEFEANQLYSQLNMEEK